MKEVSAVVLAGGRGSRFGGEKASAAFLGRPMVAWVVEAAWAVADEVLVSVGPEQEAPPLPGARLVEDATAFEGPLSGLIAGLRAATGGLVVALACDTPLIRVAVLEALLQRRTDGCDAVVPVVGGFEQPLIAVYRRETALAAFERALVVGDRSLRRAVAGLRVDRIDEDKLRPFDPGLVSFRAANTPSELRALEALAERPGGGQDAGRSDGGDGSG